MNLSAQEAAAAGLKPLSVTYRAGERIVAAAEIGTCLFLVQSGRVRLTCPGTGDATAREVAILEKGDFFGEATLFDRRPYGIDAEAVVDSDVIEIGANTFQRMLQTNPEMALRLIRRLAGRVADLESLLAGRPAPSKHGEELLPGAAPEFRSPRLVSVGGETVFNLNGKEMLLGRYDPVTEIQPEIDLTDLDVQRSVSRRHARLNFQDGEWMLSEEAGALNGTFLNGVRLGAGRSSALRPGDQIALGMVHLVFQRD